jgi:hypothetical protein
MPKPIWVDEPPPYRLKRHGEIISTYQTAEAVLADWQLGDVVYTSGDRMLTSREQLEALARDEKRT